MPNYPPDPGGIFASDYHRRVMAHMPLPKEDAASLDELLQRLHSDAYTALWYTEADQQALAAILDDLQEVGQAKYLDGSAGWRMTKAGLDGLTGPALTEFARPDHLRAQLAADLGDGQAPADDAAVDAAIAAGEKAGTILVAETDEDGAPTLMRFEALPLAGRKLEEMEAHDERLAAEDEDIDKRAHRNAVEVAKEQLAAAEKAAEEVGA